jgi:diguanylate cyclase (GGDEF)-like protein
MALGSAPAGDDDDRQERARSLLLGRCAGFLFLAGAVASAPANQMLSDPEPGWYMHLINVLALISGLVCVKLPWDRMPSAALHAIPFVATSEVVLTVTALGVHGEVYLWYFVLSAVFTGYAFRNRWHVAGHMGVTGFAFLSTAIFSFGWDQDALVRALVAVPTLAVAAGVVAWLREGLEAREQVAHKLFQEREREARTDMLTGLGNRRALMQALDEAARPGAEPRTLALYDLDGFKLYNDRFGHPAGDDLLVRISTRLLEAAGDRGVAFRLGGDEFCVLLQGCRAESERLVTACANALGERGVGFEIAASWGAVALPSEADTPTAALSAADRRMYAVKDRRRKRARDGARDVLLALQHERRGGSRVPDVLVSLGDDVREPSSVPESAPDPTGRPAS